MPAYAIAVQVTTGRTVYKPIYTLETTVIDTMTTKTKMRSVNKRSKRFSINDSEQLIILDGIDCYLRNADPYNRAVASALKVRIKSLRNVVRPTVKLSREKYRQ